MIAPSKDLEKQVREIEKMFPCEVVGIRYSLGDDWSGDPGIFFKVLLTDAVSRREVIGDIAHRVKWALNDIVFPDSPDYYPYVNYRSESEQQKLNDPAWPSLTTS